MARKDIKTIRRDNKINQEKTDNSVKWAFWLFVIFIIIIWSFHYGKSTFSAVFLSLGEHNQIVEIQQTPVEVALSNISLHSSYKIVDLNSQKNLYMNIQLDNNNNQAIKNFEIQCIPDFGTASVQKLKVTVLEKIEAHSILSLKDYNFGIINDSPKYVNCSITDLVLY